MKRKLPKLFVLAGLSLILGACSKVYSPALYHQDIAYMPKPTSWDEKKSATYISGGGNIYTNPNNSDGLVSGQINLSEGHVFKGANVAYGAFGVFGDYSSNEINSSGNSQSTDRFFGAVGGRFSANAFVHNDRVDFRFIGVEAVYSHEFGSYADFRKAYARLSPDNYVDTRTDLFSAGLTTEVIFHNQNNKHFQHGIRGYLGFTAGHNPLNDTYYRNDNEFAAKAFRALYPKASYYMKINDFFGTIEVGSAFMFRFGYSF